MKIVRKIASNKTEIHEEVVEYLRLTYYNSVAYLART